MPKTDFKTRVGKAVEKLITDKRLLDIRQNSLYTPMCIDGKWSWMAFSEPDGLLAKKFSVLKGEPAHAPDHSEVIACVMVQSEETTSSNLLNPWGKACIPDIPNGVWIDYNDGSHRKRRILMASHVLLVTPKPASTTVQTQKDYETRKSILERVDEASSNVTLLIVGQNDSKRTLARKIWKSAKKHLT